MAIYTRFHHPVSFAIRQVPNVWIVDGCGHIIMQALQNQPDYKSAMAYLTEVRLIAPAYIIMGGREKNQAAVITRDRMQASDVWALMQNE